MKTNYYFLATKNTSDLNKPISTATQSALDDIGTVADFEGELVWV